MAGPLGETTPGMAGYVGVAGSVAVDALTADVDPPDEVVVVVGNTVASQHLAVATKPEAAFDMTLHVATTTLVIDNPPTGLGRLTLILRQDGTGSRLVTFPASFKWAGGTPPTLTTTATTGVDVVVADTADSGVTWFARVAVAAAA